MKSWPQLYDSAGANRVAVLDAAYSAVVTDQCLDSTGGQEVLDFSLALNDPKLALLDNEMCVLAPIPQTSPQQYSMFKIRQMTKGTDNSGNKTMLVHCEATWYDLGDADVVRIVPGTNNPTTALTALLAGTGWTVGTVGVSTSTQQFLMATAGTPLSGIRSLPGIFGGELQFDTVNKTVSLLAIRGSQSGEFLYARGSNVSSDTRLADTTQLTTRLRPVGASNIDISSVNGGVTYIEDYTYFDSRGWPRQVRAQLLSNDAITDPAALLAWAQAQLLVLRNPRYTYTIDLAVLNTDVMPNLGDLIQLYDASIGLRASSRVWQRTIDLLQPFNTKLQINTAVNTLTNAVGASIPQSTIVTVPADGLAPAAPASVTLTQVDVVDQSGNHTENIVGTWPAVTTNSDATPLADFDHYEMQYNVNGGGWISGGSTTATGAVVAAVAAGQIIIQQVRCVDSSGNASGWTASAPLTVVNPPVTQPGASVPILSTNFPLALGVTWDGLTSVGGVFAADLTAMNVYYSTTPGFTPSSANLVGNISVAGGTIQITGLTPGTQYYVKFLPVTTNGRVGATASAQASGTVLPVSPTQTSYNGDYGNHIPDGSFESIGRRAQITADASWVSSVNSFVSGSAGDGSWNLRLTSTANPGTQRRLTLVRQSVIGATSKFWTRAKMRANASTNGNAQLGVIWYDGNGNALSTQILLNDSSPVTGSYDILTATTTPVTGAAAYDVFVQLTSACTTGSWDIDSLEMRDVIQTAIIDNLAVTDANIASLTVSKLTAGSLLADMTMAARIKTADTGARVEMNALGIFAYNSGGTQTVKIGSDGSATFTGTVVGSVVESSADTTISRSVMDSTYGFFVAREATTNMVYNPGAEYYVAWNQVGAGVTGWATANNYQGENATPSFLAANSVFGQLSNKLVLVPPSKTYATFTEQAKLIDPIAQLVTAAQKNFDYDFKLFAGTYAHVGVDAYDTVASVASNNVILNSRFDSGTFGNWNKDFNSGGVAVGTPTYVISAGEALVVDNLPASSFKAGLTIPDLVSQASLTSDAVACSAGQIVRVKVIARRSVASTTGYYVRLLFGTSSNFVYNSATPFQQTGFLDNAALGVAWQANTVSFVVPDTCTFFRVMVLNNTTSSAAGTVYLGQIQAELENCVIANNGFESNTGASPTNWTTNYQVASTGATATVAANNAYSGSNSLQITTTTTTNGMGVASDTHACVAGQVLVLAGWYKRSVATSTALFISIDFGTAASWTFQGAGYLSRVSGIAAGAATTAYQYFQTTVTVPATATFFRMVVHNWTSAAAGTMYFDQLSVTLRRGFYTVSMTNNIGSAYLPSDGVTYTDGFFNVQMANLLPSTTYTATINVACDLDNYFDAAITGVKEASGAGRLMGMTYSSRYTHVPAGSWQTYTWTFTTPSDWAGPSQLVLSGPRLADGTVLDQGELQNYLLFDNLQVEPKAYATDYVDGDLGPGYSWSVSGSKPLSSSQRSLFHSADFPHIGSPTIRGTLNVDNLYFPPSQSVLIPDVFSSTVPQGLDLNNRGVQSTVQVNQGPNSGGGWATTGNVASGGQLLCGSVYNVQLRKGRQYKFAYNCAGINASAAATVAFELWFNGVKYLDESLYGDFIEQKSAAGWIGAGAKDYYLTPAADVYGEAVIYLRATTAGTLTPRGGDTLEITDMGVAR